jgi:hypothetical protein
LRPDNCTFDDYQAWFQGECDTIVLKPGFSVVNPKVEAIKDPAPPWSVIFAIIYDDGMYIRIYEHYRELSKREGGGGRLQYFSYHYGPCGDERDDDGLPDMENRCVLRIDIDRKSKCHAHYDGENHIPEDRLLNLDFDTLTPFNFIRAVEQHRATNTPLPEILGFEVKAKE